MQTGTALSEGDLVTGTSAEPWEVLPLAPGILLRGVATSLFLGAKT